MDREDLAEKILFLTENEDPEYLQEKAEFEWEAYYGIEWKKI